MYFHHIATIEDFIKVKEIQMELQPSPENEAELIKMEAKLKKYLHLEVEFWKKKAEMKCFVECNNRKVLHSYIKGRRKK